MGPNSYYFITGSDQYQYKKGAQRKYTNTLAIFLLHRARKIKQPRNAQLWTVNYDERQCQYSHSVET